MTDDKTKDDILGDALDVWGEEVQIDIAIEELSELTTELARVQRGRADPEDVVEEIADAQLCLDQLAMMFGRAEVAVQLSEKLERLNERVEEDRDDGGRDDAGA